MKEVILWSHRQTMRFYTHRTGGVWYRTELHEVEVAQSRHKKGLRGWNLDEMHLFAITRDQIEMHNSEHVIYIYKSNIQT